jgi:hypothetical protein
MDAAGREMTLNIQLNHDGEYHTAIPSATAVEARTTHHNCDEEALRIPGSIQRHGFCCFWMKRPGMWLRRAKTRRSFSESR